MKIVLHLMNGYAICAKERLIGKRNKIMIGKLKTGFFSFCEGFISIDLIFIEIIDFEISE